MLSTGLLSWITSDQQIMSTMAHNWVYGLLIVAAIVFLETGMVVLPFLPETPCCSRQARSSASTASRRCRRLP